MTENLPYAEGTVFLVRLRPNGFARGLVARTSEQGHAVFGYFFGPRMNSMEAASFDGMRPHNAIKRLMFGDLHLLDGHWPIVGVLPNWDRAQWPMPDFVRIDPLGLLPKVQVRYSDNDTMQVEGEWETHSDQELEPDRASGGGAVELKLSAMLQTPRQ